MAFSMALQFAKRKQPQWRMALPFPRLRYKFLRSMALINVSPSSNTTLYSNANIKESGYTMGLQEKVGCCREIGE
jgi:hypothetical protein